MIINLIILIFVLILLIFLSMVWPPNSPWAPNWRTNKKTALAICKLAKIGPKDLIYDLGSGDGEALVTAARKFGAKGIGIEIDPIRHLVAKLRAQKNGVGKDVKFIRGNFFDQNISNADVVFVYLVPKALNLLIPKFKKELKKGTRIVSYKYKMDLKMVARDSKNEIYLFII